MTVGTIEDSRVRVGTLTLDGTAFAKQMVEIKLVPATEEDGDAVETASGATIEPDEITTWTLDLGAIQDFNDPAGFVNFARVNAGEIVPFSWVPTTGVSPTLSGSVRVRAVQIGGPVATRNNSETSWPVIGDPDVVYPGP